MSQTVNAPSPAPSPAPSQQPATLIDIAGETFHVAVDGPADAPALMFSNSLGANLHMWRPQVEALSRHFRIVRYDSRGHGLSTAPERPYSVAELGRDALAILDALGIGKAHWCGLSKGGMVGQWLLANAPDRLGRVVLANTTAVMGPPDNWNARIRTVRAEGMGALVDAVVERWFTPGFRASRDDAVAPVRAAILATPPQGYAGCCAALRDMDQREAIRTARNPVLVIVGTQDPATPPAAGEFLASRIPGAKLVALDAAHLSNVEQAAAFNAALLDFLTEAGETDERKAAGMRQRRRVLGDTYVDAAVAATTGFTREWQDFITRTAWNDIWNRPGLAPKTRSVIVLSITTALRHWDEFRIHVRGALNNGLTRDEIKEVLLQSAIYAGVPAANHAFKEAQAVFAEIDASSTAR